MGTVLFSVFFAFLVLFSASPYIFGATLSSFPLSELAEAGALGLAPTL